MPGRLRRRKQAIEHAGGSQTEAAVIPPSVHQCLDPAGPTRHSPCGWELTQSADRAVVGLVAQGVRTGVTQAEVATGQDQGVPDI